MGLVSTTTVGRLDHGAPLHFSFGGAECNAAITASRLGSRVAWASRLGDDSVGHAIRRALAAEGITVVAQTVPDRPTGLMVKERRSPLRQRVSYYRSGSAASTFRHTDLDDELLAQTGVVLVSGVTAALTPHLPDELESLFSRAHDAGALVALDLNFRSALWTREDARRTYDRLAPAADLLFSGVDEASIVSEAAVDLSTALIALGRYDRAIIVATDGARGAAARTPDGDHYVDAVAVPVIDTVGAGDAFVGGFLAEWQSHADVSESLRTAAAAGAHACMFAGDWEGAPTRDDLAQLSQGFIVER